MHVSNPVVIVTAASKGIGAGVARFLSSRGYRLSLFARSDDVSTLADELRGMATQGSVQHEDDLRKLVKETLKTFGRIDALVNNTGHPAKGDLLSPGDGVWQEGFELILRSVIQLARLITPVMRNQGGGSIVNISSYAAVRPELERPISSVFRAGLSAWTRLHAEYGAPYGIRVNSVLPGFIEMASGSPACRHDSSWPLRASGGTCPHGCLSLVVRCFLHHRTESGGRWRHGPNALNAGRSDNCHLAAC